MGSAGAVMMFHLWNGYITVNIPKNLIHNKGLIKKFIIAGGNINKVSIRGRLIEINELHSQLGYNILIAKLLIGSLVPKRFHNCYVTRRHTIINQNFTNRAHDLR